MLSALEVRGAAAGERVARDMAERLAERIAAQWPDLRAEATRDGVTIEGRGLRRRRIDEPALRHPTELLR